MPHRKKLPLLSHARACSNSAIKGNYAFTRCNPGSPSRCPSLREFPFAVKRNLVDAINDYGRSVREEECSVDGTQTILVPGLPDLHLQFIVAQSGNTIHQLVIDPGFATTAEGGRIRGPEEFKDNHGDKD